MKTGEEREGTCPKCSTVYNVRMEEASIKSLPDLRKLVWTKIKQKYRAEEDA